VSALAYEDIKEDRAWDTLEAVAPLRSSPTTVLRPVGAVYIIQLWAWLEDPYEITAPEDAEAPP